MVCRAHDAFFFYVAAMVITILKNLKFLPISKSCTRLLRLTREDYMNAYAELLPPYVWH